jgi:hypothetical protein
MPDTLDEILDGLKTDHNIDVRALQVKAAEAEGVAELSAKLTEALGSNGIIKLSNGEVAKSEDLVLAVGQLVTDKTELSNRVDALELSNRRAAAEAEVDKLIEGGFVAESTRQAFIDLKLSNEETFAALVPEQPIIKLSGEATAFAPADSKPSEVVQSEIDRYAAAAAVA